MTLLISGIILGQSFDPETGTWDNYYKASGLMIPFGFNYSKIHYNNSKDSTIHYRAGVNFGLEYKFTNIISGITFQQRGYKIRFNSSNHNLIKYNYLSLHCLIPTFSIYRIINLYTGFQTGIFLFGSKISKQDYNSSSYDSNSDETKFLSNDNYRNDVGLIVGLKYPISRKLELMISYYYGIVELKNDIDIVDNWKNNSLSTVLIIDI